MNVELVNTVIDDMANEIARLKDKLAEREWVKSSERLPDEDVEVLIYLYRDVPFIAHVNSKGCWCTDDFLIGEDDEPIAWMPLPQPYKAERKTR